MTEQFALRVGAMVCRDEIKHAWACGATMAESFEAGYSAMDEIFDIAMAPDRPLITLPMRKVWRK